MDTTDNQIQMSRESRSSRLGTGPLLIIGFAFTLVLIMLLLFYGLRQLETIHGNLRDILDNNNIKTALVSEMRTASRERTLNLLVMIGLEDPFERDEVFLEFNKNGARFARARLALLEMPLSEAEREVLDRQGKRTAVAVPLQNAVVSLMEKEEMKAAHALLYEKAWVAQHAVLQELAKLTALQFEANEAVSVLANQEHERGNRLMLSLGLTASLIGISIAFVVTRRILATERSLFQEKELAEVTLGSITDAVITLDQDDRVTYMNPRAQQLLTVTDAGAKGRPLIDVMAFVNPDCRQQDVGVLECIRRFSQEHQGLQEPLRLKRSGEQAIWVEATVSPMRLAESRLSGKAVVIHDVSQAFEAKRALHALNTELEARVEERTAELELANRELQDTIVRLRETQDQLIQSEKMASLGGLVAGISHEINTPIGIGVTSASNINEHLGQLRASFDSGDLKRSDLSNFIEHAGQAADILMRNMHRASDLIRSFKQVAVDQSSDDWRDIDLRQYCQEILTSLHPQLKRRPLQVQNDCAEDIHLYTNPGAIYQVVSNLVLNALTHAFDETDTGNIRIAAAVEGDQVRMTVEDDGRGIGEQNLKKIFDPFFTTRRGQGGSGLGLNIVYNLVTTTLGGSISAADNVQGGACFSIQIPLRHSGERH